MGLTLYDWKNSYNSRKIRAIAFELDIPVKVATLDMQKGEHKSPAHLARNPNGKVPVLEHDDFVLWESNAICCYLATLDPRRTLLPVEPKANARVMRWLFWQQAHFAQAFGKVMYERIFKQHMGSGAPDQNLVTLGLQEVARFSTVLDGWLLGRNFIEDQLSVADFVIAATVSTRERAGIDLTPYENILRWYGRIEARDSWKRSVDM